MAGRPVRTGMTIGATVAHRMLAVVLGMVVLFLFALPPVTASAHEGASVQDEFMLGRILEITDEGIEDLGGGFTQPYRTVRLEILNGPEKGVEREMTQYGDNVSAEGGGLSPGDKVVVGRSPAAGEEGWFILDNYRIPAAALVFLVFLVLAVIFGRLKGITATIGLLFSVGVLALYVVPSILDGKNPLIVSLIGALAIAVFSLFLAHGFNRRTGIALLATLATLAIAAVLAVAFVSLARLTGFGSEEAFYLKLGLGEINLRGLLLGGIILGALGVLDDITTTQVAAVDQIRKANPKLSVRELYRRGNSVGVEHIASMINTLALAYLGASLPLFLLFAANRYQPFWVILNSQIIMEEVIRTLVGSSALICAVPISTLLAAYMLKKESEKVRK
ncbi:MAG: YibE/F family protein [Patescibacteria group bacterium]|nr:YibE/F family protein [Patescibacteria group bacterium]